MTARSPALQPGTVVGDLQISGVLGTGASSVTYLVSDPAIGTQFALKEYLPAGQLIRQDDGHLLPIDADATQNFEAGFKHFLAEARMVAALDHTGIVKVLRYFEANSTAYILMPYYQGQTLYQLLATSGTMGPEESRDLLLSMMGALDYMHQQGVVHRDIKPANIFITDSKQAILLDFGVAAIKPGNSSDGSESDLRLGSEGYAAIEQSAADGVIGPWTDIYALAATLYRCVSGRIPEAASSRLSAVDAGGPDPLIPIAKLVNAGEFGGITDAIEHGMQLSPSDRPENVRQWRGTFDSLDWHRKVVGAKHVDLYPKEGREWLPIILVGVLLLSMVAVALFLLTDEAPDGPQTQSEKPVTDGSPVAEADKFTLQPGSDEIERWQAALDADTVSAYRRFISDYPQSRYVAQAQTQLDILDERLWETLAAEDSVVAYEDYLEAFPSGLHQTQAMRRIDAINAAIAQKERQRLERERLDNLAWETAIGERTIPSLGQYISDWPAGIHIEEANRISRLLKSRANDSSAYDVAKKLDTLESFQAYIDAFPEGDHVTEALQHMDQLTLRPGKTFSDCVACPRMIVVPAGAYWQGSDDKSPMSQGIEQPRRLVTINLPFAVGIHEVTMAEWDKCFETGACTSNPEDNGWGRGNRPVMMVSWNDAQQYVHWISEETGQSYRLPSESEWEYFARAGEQSDWAGGSPEQLCAYANVAGSETGFRWQHQQCADSHALGTMPVASFKANNFGLHDTTGNVSEWTEDCMNLSYIDAPVDGSSWGRGICSSHMTRGGSWVTGTREIRLPARFNLKNGDRNDFTGFRVVRLIDD